MVRLSVTAAILGLLFLVLVHELGHFVTAFAVGMRPRKFYVGFPPPLVRTFRGGVEYGIGWIPLGGYVKIPGMHRPAPSDLELHFGRAEREAPELVGPVERVKRRVEAADFEGARVELEPLRAAVAGADLTPEARKTADRGGTELADALGPQAYWQQATWRKIAAILAGPAANFVFAIVIFAALFMIGGGKATRIIDTVLPDRPAAEAGLRSGDEIVAINGRTVTPAEIPARIQASNGRPLRLTIVRDGRRLAIGPVRARRDEGAYRLGFRLRGESLTAPEAGWEAVKLTGVVTREIGRSLARLVHREGQKEISGAVGIVQGSSNAIEEGVETYLWVLGLISLSLALFNLLPLLPLDGGHIAFSIIEGIRGRAVGREIYERVSAVGIALVLLLFVVGLSNDIGRLSGG